MRRSKSRFRRNWAALSLVTYGKPGSSNPETAKQQKRNIDEEATITQHGRVVGGSCHGVGAEHAKWRRRTSEWPCRPERAKRRTSERRCHPKRGRAPARTTRLERTGSNHRARKQRASLA